MKLSIGPVAEERRDDWWAVQQTVFGFEFKDDDKPLLAAVQNWDRALGAYDGDQMVGSASSLSLATSVPGGAEVPTAGLTAVSVLPTHRRSGALTGMIRASFDDARQRGEPLGILLASESPIYGRFGYGVGTHQADLTIDARPLGAPGRPAHHRPGPTDGGRRGSPHRPGSPSGGHGGPRGARVGGAVRSHVGAVLPRPEHWRDGASRRMWAVYEDKDGVPGGYLRYRVKEKWEKGVPDFTLNVFSLHAVDAEAYAALYSYVFGIDLVSTIELWSRPVGDPIFELLADPRRVGRVVRDGLWVRLIDVPAALAARRYRVDDRLVIEVQDDFCPWNEGRFLLEGGPDGAVCSPTDAEPDIRIGAGDLASAYLGDGRLPAQAWAGRVHGDRVGHRTGGPDVLLGPGGVEHGGLLIRPGQTSSQAIVPNTRQ